MGFHPVISASESLFLFFIQWSYHLHTHHHHHHTKKMNDMFHETKSPSSVSKFTRHPCSKHHWSVQNWKENCYVFVSITFIIVPRFVHWSFDIALHRNFSEISIDKWWMHQIREFYKYVSNTGNIIWSQMISIPGFISVVVMFRQLIYGNIFDLPYISFDNILLFLWEKQRELAGRIKDKYFDTQT